MGQSVEKDLPITWDGKTNENVLWKVPLPHTEAKLRPDLNQSSPIVWGDKIIVTTSFWAAGKSRDNYPEHHVTCYSSEGKKRWDEKVEPGPWQLGDLRGGYTAPTPRTDGERIYIIFGSGIVVALDMDGKNVWRKELPEPKKFDVCIASSPVVYGDTLLILCDKKEDSHLLALDKKTGQVKWDEKRPAIKYGHTTPVVVKVQGKDILLIGANAQLQGVDPLNGKVLWWVANEGDVPCPVLAGGLVYCDNGRGGIGIAVDPTGADDVTKTHIKWKSGTRIDGMGSPIVCDEYLYRLRTPGLISSWKMSTGERVSEARAQGVSTTASPFATADGKVYFVSAGRSVVIKAGPKIEILATNELGEDNGSSAAVSGGRIYIKGQNNLIAIGTK